MNEAAEKLLEQLLLEDRAATDEEAALFLAALCAESQRKPHVLPPEPAKLQETARYTAGLLMRHVVSIPEYTPHRGYSLSAYVLTADPRQERMKFIEEFAAAIKQDEG